MNSAARLPERQVLPRPVDHAVDLATLSSQQEPGQAVWVAVADFADAYMSVPLLERERKFLRGSLRADAPHSCASQTLGACLWQCGPLAGTGLLWMPQPFNIRSDFQRPHEVGASDVPDFAQLCSPPPP